MLQVKDLVWGHDYLITCDSETERPCWEVCQECADGKGRATIDRRFFFFNLTKEVDDTGFEEFYYYFRYQPTLSHVPIDVSIIAFACQLYLSKGWIKEEILPAMRYRPPVPLFRED